MPESKRVERRFEGSADTMLEKVAVIQDLFEGDLADFTAFDADFNTTFRDAWVADREAAEALDTDETMQDELKTLTEAVETAMGAGRDKWNQIHYFIQKAFADAKGKRDELGEDDYAKASLVTKDFIGFLGNLHTKGQKYKLPLIAAKYTQPQIDEIDTLHDDLFNANKAQEDWKKSRLGATEDRTIALNKPYITMLQVNKAAQIIYINSEAKRAQYVFDPNGGGGSEPTEFTGSVPPSGTVTIATIPYIAGRHMMIENTGDTLMEFSLRVEEGTAGGNPVDLGGSGTQTVTMGDLNDNPGATFLAVQNLGGDVGAYAVTVGS